MDMDDHDPADALRRSFAEFNQIMLAHFRDSKKKKLDCGTTAIGTHPVLLYTTSCII